MKTMQRLFGIAAIATMVCGTGSEVAAQSVSDAPDTPFKLATFKTNGAERGVFLKPGDVVSIELEGVGTLETPIEAYQGGSEK